MKFICFDSPVLLAYKSIFNKSTFLNVQSRTQEVESQYKFLETNQNKTLHRIQLRLFCANLPRFSTELNKEHNKNWAWRVNNIIVLKGAFFSLPAIRNLVSIFFVRYDKSLVVYANKILRQVLERTQKYTFYYSLVSYMILPLQIDNVSFNTMIILSSAVLQKQCYN